MKKHVVENSFFVNILKYLKFTMIKVSVCTLATLFVNCASGQAGLPSDGSSHDQLVIPDQDTMSAKIDGESLLDFCSVRMPAGTQLAYMEITL